MAKTIDISQYPLRVTSWDYPYGVKGLHCSFCTERRIPCIDYPETHLSSLGPHCLPSIFQLCYYKAGVFYRLVHITMPNSSTKRQLPCN